MIEAEALRARLILDGWKFRELPPLPGESAHVALRPPPPTTKDPGVVVAVSAGTVDDCWRAILSLRDAR